MVKRQLQTRHAFTMIELVFAIVIIAIAVLAMPTIMFTNAASQEQTLKEEAIMLTTTKIAQILTYPWDANSSPLGVLMSTSQVLGTVANPPLGLERNATTDFRIGHFPNQLRRRMTPFSNERNATGIGGIFGSNISSFNGDQVTIGAAGADQVYKKQYRMTTTVTYVTDNTNYGLNIITFDFNTTATGLSNIKMVQVTTDEQDTTGTWIPIVQMTSYSTNIGEAEFYKRRY